MAYSTLDVIEWTKVLLEVEPALPRLPVYR